MLPLELIRKDPDRARRAAELKGEPAPIGEILKLDERWRELLHKAETIKADQNRLSKEFAKTREEGLQVRLRDMAEAAKDQLTQAEAVKRELDDLLLRVPNVFHDSVPIGETEADNVIEREWGTKPILGFAARTHYDLGEALGIMDFERAARVSGSRFAFLIGEGARDLWLIPTSEVPLTNMHREEILDADRLPLKYVAYSPCFRSEAGAAGKDTRGFIRLHQFSKVELVKVTTAETSMEEFEKLTADAEDILRRLGLHYQRMSMCTGDMGFAQYKKYDLNAWCPGLNRFLEVSSCSVFNDFQAMRANLRYRPARGAPPRFAHTINGSGLALTRTIDAIIETYQRPDGTIGVPEVLRPYMGGLEVIGIR